MYFKDKKKHTEPKKLYTAIDHYKGDIAKLYNQNRIFSLKWRREQAILKKIIAEIPDRSVILDLPVGTGRLFPFYKNKNYKIYGIDISKDMLKEASAYGLKLDLNDSIRLKEGNAEKIPLDNASVDHVICLRLLNLVPLSVLEKILKEFSRVSSKRVIFQFRAIEKAGLIKLSIKMMLDFQTHLNRLIYFLYSKTFRKIRHVSNNNSTDNLVGGYFLHNIEDIKKIIQKTDLTITKIIEVDKGMDFSKGHYKPFLIIDCLKQTDDK